MNTLKEFQTAPRSFFKLFPSSFKQIGILLFFIFCLTVQEIYPQSTEDFESPEVVGTTQFTDNGQVFNLTGFDIEGGGFGVGPSTNIIDNVSCPVNPIASGDTPHSSSIASSGSTSFL